jgi:hypothetical protein
VEVTRLARIFGAILLASILSPSLARADEPPNGDATPTKAAMEEARTHYARGVKLYGEGLFSAALVELDRANKLAPSYKILYSIALVQLPLSDFAGAKDSFERYLAGGGDEVPAARRAEVQGRLAELAGRIALVDLTVTEADAIVLVDDIAIGKAPLGRSIALNPGFHKIAASKPGFTGEAKQLGCAGGDKLQIEIRLTAVAPVVVPVPVPIAPMPTLAPVVKEPVPVLPLPAAEPPSGSSPPWIGWTVTGVFAAGAVVTGIAALGQSSKLTSEINREPATAAQIDSAHEKTVTLALASDVLTGAAVVAGAATLYFALVRGHHTAQSARLTVGPGSVGFDGTF